MTWPDVEFVDPAGLPLVETDPPPGQARLPARFPVSSMLSLVGWIAAGGLAVLASFRLAYSASFASAGAPTVHFNVDAWGREQFPNNTPAFGEHGARMGIVFSATAGLFALLVALAIWRAWRGSARVRPNPAITALAVAAPCVLAAVTVTQWLVIDGVLSGYRAINRQNATIASGASSGSGSAATPGLPAIHTHVGPSIWLAGVAFVCAAVASTIYLWPHRGDATIPAVTSADAETDAAEPQPEHDAQLDDAEFLV